jgi:hypothetical protein
MCGLIKFGLNIYTPENIVMFINRILEILVLAYSNEQSKARIDYAIL